MSRDDRARWDSRYDGATPADPCPFLVRHAERLPEGLALDLACGTGANALYLASRGHTVVAADGSAVALSILKAAARERGLSACVHPVLTDFDHPGLRASGRAAVVVCVSFLHRPLLELIPRLVRPRGVVVFETFHCGYLARRPSFPPEYTLSRDEAETLFPSLSPIEVVEGETRSSSLWIRPAD